MMTDAANSPLVKVGMYIDPRLAPYNTHDKDKRWKWELVLPLIGQAELESLLGSGSTVSASVASTDGLPNHFANASAASVASTGHLPGNSLEMCLRELTTEERRRNEHTTPLVIQAPPLPMPTPASNPAPALTPIVAAAAKPKPIRIRALPIAGILQTRSALYRPLPNAAVLKEWAAVKSGRGVSTGWGRVLTKTQMRNDLRWYLPGLQLWALQGRQRGRRLLAALSPAHQHEAGGSGGGAKTTTDTDTDTDASITTAAATATATTAAAATTNATPATTASTGISTSTASFATATTSAPASPTSMAPSNLHRKLIDQLTYYFSDENLRNDNFLLKEMSKNKGGYVMIKLVASL
jgi:hypothetical protein